MRLLLKKVFYPIFSLLLLYLSYQYVVAIYLLQTPLIFSEELHLALLLNLSITGVFAFIGFAYPTSSLLMNNYYRIHQPKLLMTMYRILGVSVFRKFIILLFWGFRKNKKKYFNGKKSGITHLIFQSKQSEFGHLAAVITLTACSMACFNYGHFSLFVWINLINVFGNLYPILLQRFHRLRIHQMGIGLWLI